MYDVAVVGGGPAGGSAAVFLAKAGMKTLVLDNDRGQTRGAWLENHFGFPDGVSGPDLVESGRRQAMALGAEWVTCQVAGVERSGSGFAVTTENGDTYEARQILLATGAALAMGEKLNLAFTAGREDRYPKVLQVDIDGRTSENGVWAAGIIAGCSAHTIITSGHGAQVAVGLLSDGLGKRVVQHDVLERANRRQPSPTDLQDHVDSEQHRQPPAQQQLREHMQTQHQMASQGDARSNGQTRPEDNMRSPDYMQSQNDLSHNTTRSQDYMQSQNDIGAQHDMSSQKDMQSRGRMDPQERIQSQSHMQSENPIESQTPHPTADMRQPGQMQPQARLQPQARMQPQMSNEARQQMEKQEARQLAREAEQRQERNDMRSQQPPQPPTHD